MRITELNKAQLDKAQFMVRNDRLRREGLEAIQQFQLLLEQEPVDRAAVAEAHARAVQLFSQQLDAIQEAFEVERRCMKAERR